MNRSFTPSFQHFHKDVERYLESEGKCEKNEHGQMVYRGYPAAVEKMFRVCADDRQGREATERVKRLPEG